MRRPQFTLQALLAAILVAAAFFGGMAAQRRLNRPQVPAVVNLPLLGPCERIVLQNGTVDWRPIRQPLEPDSK